MQMSKQELANSAGNFAGSLMRDGYSNEEIIDSLLEEGLNQDDAEAIVRQLLKLRADDIRQRAQIYRVKAISFIIASILVGMFVNNFFLNGLGYLLMLLGFGLGVKELFTYFTKTKEAELVQFSLYTKR